MVSSSTSAMIVNRFFFTLRLLIKTNKLRGINTFTSRYGIDRRNLLYVEKNPTSKQFDVAWLVYLARDFDVTTDWLLLGKGSIFRFEE